jgi:6-phosphofructokinase 2
MAPRIVTLTLNPAVDLAWEAENVRPTDKIRTRSEHYDPGGGGLNVARVVRTLGGDSLAVLLSGGVTGMFLQDLLEQSGQPVRNIPIGGRTRLSVAVHDRADNNEYRFVAEGPEITETEWRSALHAVEIADTDWVVASGSLPRGVPVDAYRRLAVATARRGRHLVLDTSGPALSAALGSGVSLIKPSLNEFEALVGRALADRREQAEAAAALVRAGASEMIAVSLGADGALLVTRAGAWHLAAAAVAVHSTVGAGDSFVAAMTLALARGEAPKNAFAWGVAAGTSAVMHYGTARPDRAEVEYLHATLLQGVRQIPLSV